jgi:hypothetical protein
MTITGPNITLHGIRRRPHRMDTRAYRAEIERRKAEVRRDLVALKQRKEERTA